MLKAKNIQIMSSHHSNESQEKLHDLTTDAGVLAIAGGSVIGIHEAIKAFESEHHKGKHLGYASLAAAIAAGGYGLATRPDHQASIDAACPKHNRKHRSSSTCSDPEHERHRSNTKVNLGEEVIGAWAVVKDLLGDKQHPTVHRLEELLGLVGLFQEVKKHKEYKRG
ncbi:hypothetical protein FGG08_001106 [Glutinoglossum americanum]|uniref:Uncharacterized protein n=1 Tax=Glutinoglossum americanum TaxID=1670608 RepID=A0A9P8L5K8_9PEZI|nr:hypothetical protein FGG08_001106 [Glutinoglossum americanum]